MLVVSLRRSVGGALAAGGITLAASLGAQDRARAREYKPTIPVTQPAVAALPSAGDAVSRLVERLDRGDATLGRPDARHGYLPSVLAALDVPVDSQMLVFSKTSVQAAHISPSRPRAVYFADDVMVAHVPGTPGLEAVAIDAVRGPVFYALTRGAGGRATFTASQSCLKCHHGPNTAGVPGIYVGSVIPGPTGAPLRDESAIITDQNSPFAERWGGWYVTARRGEPPDRANAVAANPADPAALVREAGQNLTMLHGLTDPAQQLAPTSDIVALMTFEHQTQMQNLITRVAWQARIAEAAMPGRALAHPGLAADLTDLVNYMTFADEMRLPQPVEGVSSFAATFAARGPVDGQGRSLRQFDLRTRLFRYPVSYLIHSPSFAALPEVARTEILRQVYDRLVSPGDERRPGGPSAADWRDAVAIVAALVPGLPAFWRVPR